MSPCASGVFQLFHRCFRDAGICPITVQATGGVARRLVSAATPLHGFLLGQAAEGDRPACHVHLSDAVLPIVPRFAAQVVDRSRRQLGGSPVKASSAASSESHRRRRPKRDADDMLEHRTIPMPTDPGARIVPDQQRLNEVIRFEAREPRRPLAQRKQPIRDWFRRREALPSQSRSSSQTRRSCACPAIRGSGRATVSSRRSMR